MPEDEGFSKGCAHFDRGEYFEAHEVWEDLWMEAIGVEHAFLQGMIQTAVALYHAGNENFRGAEKMLAKALSYLEKGKAHESTVNLEAFIGHMLTFESAIRKRMAGETVPLPYFKIPYKVT